MGRGRDALGPRAVERREVSGVQKGSQAGGVTLKEVEQLEGCSTRWFSLRADLDQEGVCPAARERVVDAGDGTKALAVRKCGLAGLGVTDHVEIAGLVRAAPESPVAARSADEG